MTSVRYVQPDGSENELDVEPPMSVMRAAVTNGVPGIVGECGGQAMCATCHVYVEPEFADALPPMSDDEDEMLDSAASPRTESSRLSCQLKDLAIDRLVVDIPPRQQ